MCSSPFGSNTLWQSTTPYPQMVISSAFSDTISPRFQLPYLAWGMNEGAPGGWYSARLVVPIRVAPATKKRVTWLRRWMVPERYQPGGSRTCPPPAEPQASMALLMGLVSRVRPSPAAPYCRTSQKAGDWVSALRAGLNDTRKKTVSVRPESAIFRLPARVE